MVKPSKLAASYIGGITHAHTVLSNHTGHHESDLTIDRIVQTLREARLAGEAGAPLNYIMLNEHPSDPTHPKRLGRLSLRGRRLLRQRRRPMLGRMPILYGLEVSLLPGGGTDLTPRLADRCPLVIASRHGLPAKIERDPTAIAKLFHEACDNSAVDVLGHPPRYIEDLPGVEWPQIFRWAAQTGTAVEVNLNSFPKDNSQLGQTAFWRDWLIQLALSGAEIFIGTDLHSQLQLEKFIAEWHTLDSTASRHDNHLSQFLDGLAEANISTDRVVTADYQRFLAWLALDKPARARLH